MNKSRRYLDTQNNKKKRYSQKERKVDRGLKEDVFCSEDNFRWVSEKDKSY